MSVSRDWHFMIASQVGITIIFAISFNQLLGQTGLLNLGHSIFMGAGSYFSGLILLQINNGALYIPLPILPLLGGVAGFIVAGIIGYFSVQRAGMIFAMLTLAILEFVNSFSISFPSVLGGMTVDRTINTDFFNFDYSSKKTVCHIVMTWLFISLYVSYYFLQKPLGKMCNAVRENPSRTEYIGYSIYMVRYLSICFSNLQFFFKTAVFLSSSTYCSRRISIAVFVDDDVLEWNLMFDDILHEKYLWLKWPKCINFCRTLHLDEGGVIYNKAKYSIVQHP